MQDSELIDLYFARNEQASAETMRQFGSYCYTIANHILGNQQDAEECVNDVLIRLWEHIPPARPDNLFAYIASAARSIALNRLKHSRAVKRGGGEQTLVLEELRDCASSDNVEQTLDSKALSETINTFLGTLKPKHRKIFVQRYWYFCSVDEIAEDLNISKSQVTVTLMRTRKKLRDRLEQEGFL
ncbi:MAG TPA: RNA polymerase subunit sigma-70 [Ruminococcus sp.]|nr:RNA polymerase subunit sigma-70 [Ruminococcus sp.]